jgi:nucleotide-binding universal stress UspA family protein
MTTSKKILVPVGFTDQSIVALQQAVRVAKLTNSGLVLLSVVELPSAIKKLFSDYESEIDNYKVQIRKRLEEINSKYCSDIPDVECMVSSGKIYEEITGVAEMIDAYLIIMGTDGSSSGVSRLIMGSNTNKVIRTSPCPVISIKGEEINDGCKTIVLPLDLHKETKEKVKIAIEFAKLWNAEIKVFSVLIDDDEFIRNKLVRNLNQVQKFISDSNIVCSSELVKKDKSSKFFVSIIDYSNSVDADLLIIMTQQEENDSLTFLGSNASYVINNSVIPVMSVRPSQKRDTSSFGLV